MDCVWICRTSNPPFRARTLSRSERGSREELLQRGKKSESRGHECDGLHDANTPLGKPRRARFRLRRRYRRFDGLTCFEPRILLGATASLRIAVTPRALFSGLCHRCDRHIQSATAFAGVGAGGSGCTLAAWATCSRRDAPGGKEARTITPTNATAATAWIVPSNAL